MTAERNFIEALRSIAAHPAARGLADDAAVLEIGGEALVLTHDAMAEGVHYLAGQDPADVAWKLVATNISDLAAKGAEPIGVLLGYRFGGDDARFLVGLKEALDYYGAALLGGDTIGGSGEQVIGLTAIGRATVRPVPSRAGVKPGDTLWLTGMLGGAMAGLEALRSGSGNSTAYRRPQARLSEGLALAPQVTAMMDVSDGLLLDAYRMAEASGVTLSVARLAPPIAVPEARRDEALRWGDDYELLFTLPPGTQPTAPATCIGKAILRAESPLFLDEKPLPHTSAGGFEHH